MNMVAIHTNHLLKTSSHKTIVSVFIQKKKRELIAQRKARELEEANHKTIGKLPMAKALKRTIAR